MVLLFDKEIQAEGKRITVKRKESENVKESGVDVDTSGIVKYRIPSRIFKDRGLSPMESITEYLKEEEGMTYHEIAELVNRNDRTIWTCYNRAKKKRTKKGEREEIERDQEGEHIPIHIFHNRDLAPLEGISRYLKELKNKTYHEIAVLLNRDDRTIWTCYNRALKKLEVVGQTGSLKTGG